MGIPVGTAIDVTDAPVGAAPPFTTRFAAPGGVPQFSYNGGPFIPFLTARQGFVRDTLTLAQMLNPGLGFNEVVGTNGTPAWEYALSGTNTPTRNTYFSGGGLAFVGTANSWVALNPTTPGGAAYSPIIGNQFQTRAVPWFLRARLFINATQVSANSELVLLSLDKSTTGGSNAVGHIQLVIIAAGGSGPPSTTQCRIRLRGGAFTAGPVDFSCGPDGNLGTFGSYLPVNQWFNVAMWFDLETIRWAFSDIYNSANALNGLAHQLDAMPPDVGCVTCNSSALNDTTIGANYLIGGLAFAYAQSQENK